jgi:hypothetical protein
VLPAWAASDCAARRATYSTSPTGAQLDRPVLAIAFAAFDEDGRFDVVAARRIGQQIVDQIAPGLAPQVMMGVDDGEAGLEDLFRGRAGEPILARREDAAKGRRSMAGTHARFPLPQVDLDPPL